MTTSILSHSYSVRAGTKQISSYVQSTKKQAFTWLNARRQKHQHVPLRYAITHAHRRFARA